MQLIFAEPILPVAPGMLFRHDAIDTAGSLYLKAYIISLGAAIKGQAAIAAGYENTADSLLSDDNFQICMHRLNKKTHVFEDICQLPYLAEACQRAVVSQCRRHNKIKMAKQNFAGLGHQSGKNFKALRESSYLLAEQIEDLARIFYLNDKLEIADRAYQDAITTTCQTIKIPIADGKDREVLQQRFFNYAIFLDLNGKDEQALAILEKMNVICGY